MWPLRASIWPGTSIAGMRAEDGIQPQNSTDAAEISRGSLSLPASRSFVQYDSSATRSMAGDSECLGRQPIANWSSRRMMKSKILVVDDEPDALQLVEFNLKAAGYEDVTATDVGEALQPA